MDVILMEDYKLDNIPEGSCIHDVVQNGEYYIGTWSSAGGTYKVAVPVLLCTESTAVNLSPGFSMDKFLQVYMADAFADMDRIQKEMDEAE